MLVVELMACEIADVAVIELADIELVTYGAPLPRAEMPPPRAVSVPARMLCELWDMAGAVDTVAVGCATLLLPETYAAEDSLGDSEVNMALLTERMVVFILE